MGITAFATLIAELGDFAEAIIDGLARQPVIKRTTSTTTTTDDATQRRDKVSKTTTNEVQISAFHVIFFMVATGIWTPVRDAAGQLALCWWDIAKHEAGKWVDVAEAIAEGGEAIADLFEQTSDTLFGPFMELFEPSDVMTADKARMESKPYRGPAEGKIPRPPSEPSEMAEKLIGYGDDEAEDDDEP